MYIEFLLPYYKRDGYILKVACRNSVDKKYTLTINLCVLPAGAVGDITFQPTRLYGDLKLDVYM